MSYLEYSVKSTPTGPRKILYLNWPLTLLLISVSGFPLAFGFLGKLAVLEAGIDGGLLPLSDDD